MPKLIVLATCAALIPVVAFAQETPGSHFLENWDMDGNGAVSLEEIMERREIVFNMFDNDQNGALDSEEYVIFDETRASDMENNAGGHGKGGDRMQEGLTFGFNDIDTDGRVSKEEFLSNSAAWVAQIDRNGDGMITSADFGPQSN